MPQVLAEDEPSAQSDLPGFARPGGEAGAEAASCIARENAREIVRRLLADNRQPVRKAGAGMTDLFARWLERADPDIATCWHESFSRAFLALRSGGEASLIEAVMALAIHLTGCGEAGHWTAQAGAPMRCLFGSWLLPAFDRIAVRSDGTEAVLGLAGRGTAIRFTAAGPQWRLADGDPDELPRVGIDGRTITLLPRAADGAVRDQSHPAVVEHVTPEIAAPWQDALLLIRDHAPEYGSWIGDAVRHVAVLEATPGRVVSGTHGHRYGVIDGSALATAPSTAEMLVHEASHQYYLMLTRLGPVDDGTDNALYYSPVVDRARPLHRILFTFHACVNILAFYRLCMSSRVPHRTYFESREALVVDQIEQLSVPLRGNPALTPLGRVIFETWAGIRC